MSLDNSLHVDGCLEGQVESLADISIGKQGQVSGFITARTIFLSGRLDGKVNCSSLEILEGGCFIGDLLTGSLTIEPGGRFIGQSLGHGDLIDLDHQAKLEKLELKTEKD